MATAAEAEDTEVDGGGGVGLMDADELQGEFMTIYSMIWQFHYLHYVPQCEMWKRCC